MSNPVTPAVFPIPLWVAPPPRPIDRERRKDPGALHRHAQAHSGRPQARQLRQRNTDDQAPSAERVVSLWS